MWSNCLGGAEEEQEESGPQGGQKVQCQQSWENLFCGYY